jgi:hypothetical protein
MAVDRALRTVRMLVVAEDDATVDTWEGTGRLGHRKPDGTYMTEDEVADWFGAATGSRQALRLCNHEDSCGLPDVAGVEVVGGQIQAKTGAPLLDLWDAATMQRQFLEFEDGRVHRLEPGQWTQPLVNAEPTDRIFDDLDAKGQPVNPRVRDTR